MEERYASKAENLSRPQGMQTAGNKLTENYEHLLREQFLDTFECFFPGEDAELDKASKDMLQ